MTLDEQQVLEPKLRESIDDPNYRHSLMSLSTSDREKIQVHVNQLNYKIAGLEGELESWRSGLHVPIEDQFVFDCDGEALSSIQIPLADADIVNNGEIQRLERSASCKTMPMSQNKEEEHRGILNRSRSEGNKVQNKHVTIIQPKAQNEDADQMRISIESNKGQQEKIHHLKNKILELENKLETMRSGLNLPEDDRIPLGVDATEEFEYVHDTCREVCVQGVGILKDWVVSTFTGLMGGVNKIATCIAGATNSQPHREYNTFAN